MGQSTLGIPNLTVGEFMHDFVPKAYQDVHGVNPQIFDIANAMTDFASYAADRDLARKWNLMTQGGTVTLHRIVLVFHGGDVALCEEVA